MEIRSQQPVARQQHDTITYEEYQSRLAQVYPDSGGPSVANGTIATPVITQASHYYPQGTYSQQTSYVIRSDTGRYSQPGTPRESTERSRQSLDGWTNAFGASRSAAPAPKPVPYEIPIRARQPIEQYQPSVSEVESVAGGLFRASGNQFGSRSRSDLEAGFAFGLGSSNNRRPAAQPYSQISGTRYVVSNRADSAYYSRQVSGQNLPPVIYAATRNRELMSDYAAVD